MLGQIRRKLLHLMAPPRVHPPAVAHPLHDLAQVAVGGENIHVRPHGCGHDQVRQVREARVTLGLLRPERQQPGEQMNKGREWRREPQLLTQQVFSLPRALEKPALQVEPKNAFEGPSAASSQLPLRVK